ncbi:MAG: DMT family transporter [Rhodospirillales bacterium]|nr:DMT family transporter [Rhodospirillales bacterium]
MTADGPSPNPTNIRRGILWMILASVLFATMNASAKYLYKTYPIAEVVWARYFFHSVLLVILLRHRLVPAMRTRKLGLQIARSILLFLTSACFFAGLYFIPLAESSAIMFTAPILVTVLSAPLLGEHVGTRRWAGAAVGFIGALIITRPGFGVLQMPALLPFAAACCYAAYQILTRSISSSDGPMTTFAYAGLVGVIATSAALPLFWITPDAAGWFFMALVGLLGGAGHFLVIKGLAAAPASIASPFGYAILIWVTLYGYFIFGDFPDPWTIVGALLIVAGGLYIFRRERNTRTSRTPLP